VSAADIQGLFVGLYHPERALPCRFRQSAAPTIGSAPRWESSPERIARMRATTDMFLAHLLRPTTSYQPDIAALQAAPARIVVGAGATSKGQLANRTAMALPPGSARPWSNSPVTAAAS
jgi:hypothetical protein